MIDLDDRAALAQRGFLGQFFHRQDRPDRDVQGIADFHHLIFGLGHRPGLNGVENFIQFRQARLRGGVAGVGLPFRLVNQIADLLPDRGLGDEIGVGIGVGFMPLAFEDAAGLAAAGIVARTRHGLAERLAPAELGILFQRACRQALLVAQFDPAQVQHAVLHRREHALPAPGLLALIQRGDDAERQMQAGAGIADLRAGDQRRAVDEAGGGGRAARALGDIFIHLAVLIGTWAEALDRGHDHARVQFLNALPAEAHAIQRTGGEVLRQHIAFLDQPLQHLLALGLLGVQSQRTLVVIEHREIQRIGARLIHQLLARRIARARPLDLNYIRTQPSQQLSAGRPGLDMGEV